MAASEDGPNLTDYIVTSISPVLIMGLIGSLVFFLVEILYAGKYEGRLLWTLFFFVVGIVLVSRVAIQIDAGRAAGYGLALAVVCWLALMAFIEYPRDSSMAPFAPVINGLLMSLVWWCASQLTWDCTFIDESRPSSSKGLLVATGMEPTQEVPGKPAAEPRRGKTSGGFWDRYRRYRERRAKRPHNPGITVIYCSLAALPIFGLGQSLIPAGEGDRRGFSFVLAAIYVGCSLGLLLTTSFLGLRRYLRQRDVKMPAVMTGTWLGAGAILIVALVLVAALLPRPYSETPIWNLDRLVSKERSASKNAVLRKGAPGKDDGAGGRKSTPGENEATGEKGEPGGKGEGDRKDGSGDKEKAGGGGKSGKDKQGNNNSPADKAEKKSSDEEESQGSPQKKKDDKTASKSTKGSDRNNQRTPAEELSRELLEKLASFLKWLVFIVLGLAVLFVIFRWGLQYFANFSDWAKSWLAAMNRWLESLFGWRKRGGQSSNAAAVPVVPKRPFHSFSNPWSDGTAEGRPVEELIQYSFEALEAWANDRNHPRQPSETALEFASRLSSMFPSLGRDAHRLAVLVAQHAYAQGLVPKDSRELLEQFWDRVTSLMPEPAEA